MRTPDSEIIASFNKYIERSRELLRVSEWSDSIYAVSVFVSILEKVVPEGYLWELSTQEENEIPNPILIGYDPELNLDYLAKQLGNEKKRDDSSSLH